MLDHQIGNRVDGVCVFGSTGGNGSFSEDEMKRGIEVAAHHVDGRISVIAGTGARTTAGCTRLSRHAEAVGCDGVMILPMTYWPLTLDEVRAHYERVADAIGLPICVYNNPWTHRHRHAARVPRRAGAAREHALRQGKHRRSRAHQRDPQADRRRRRDHRRLGVDEPPAFSAGATGWAPVVTNFLPGLAMAFFRAAVHDRDLAGARAMWDRLFPICELICAKSHIRVGHTGLDILGRPVGPPRRPLRLLDEKIAGCCDRCSKPRARSARRKARGSPPSSGAGASVAVHALPTGEADMSRTATEWAKRPSLPATHFVDNAIFTSEEIFREEKEKIFDRVWKFVCHDQELPEPFDYRTTTLAGTPLIVSRDGDGRVRGFVNACSHRGSLVLRRPRGNARRWVLPVSSMGL